MSADARTISGWVFGRYSFKSKQMSMTTTRSRTGKRSVKSRRDEAVRQQVVHLLRKEIKFVPNHSFFHVDEDMEQQILLKVEAAQPEEGAFTPTRGLPAHLARLCETEPLSPHMERELFFRMNYLMFRANTLRSRLDPNRPDIETVKQVERLLTAARVFRNRILQANTRLVASVVKKFVTRQHSFDDLLSEGMGPLIQAVNNFDYDRGYRFSTYAYRAISRHAYRTIANDHRRATRFMTGSDESVFEAADSGTHSEAGESARGRLHWQLRQLIDRLDRRDRFVIRCRFALGGHRKVKTCQYLADKLGLSKERVRQLEHRALARLRAMASEMQLQDLADAVLA